MSDVAEPMNPYDGFKLLRDHAPVTQIEADGPWQVARHADVHAVMRDHATFSSDVSIQPPEERGAPSMLLRNIQPTKNGFNLANGSMGWQESLTLSRRPRSSQPCRPTTARR